MFTARIRPGSGQWGIEGPDGGTDGWGDYPDNLSAVRAADRLERAYRLGRSVAADESAEQPEPPVRSTAQTARGVRRALVASTVDEFIAEEVEVTGDEADQMSLAEALTALEVWRIWQADGEEGAGTEQQVTAETSVTSTATLRTTPLREWGSKATIRGVIADRMVAAGARWDQQMKVLRCVRLGS